mgnify:CR=1 FL=1
MEKKDIEVLERIETKSEQWQRYAINAGTTLGGIILLILGGILIATIRKQSKSSQAKSRPAMPRTPDNLTAVAAINYLKQIAAITGKQGHRNFARVPRLSGRIRYKRQHV